MSDDGTKASKAAVEHCMTARTMHEQCPFATPNGDPPRVLHCALKEGHEQFGYGHVDTYEAIAGVVESWHEKWFQLPEDELLRLRSIPVVKFERRIAMETQTIKPFTESATCVKCGASDPTRELIPTISMYGTINTRFCPGGKEPEEEQNKNPIHAILSLLPSLGNPLEALKPRINICAGIGEEHLHRTCPRCGFEWLTAVHP